MKAKDYGSIALIKICHSPLHAHKIVVLFSILVLIIAIDRSARRNKLLVLWQIQVMNAKMYGMVVQLLENNFADFFVPKDDLLPPPNDVQLGLVPSVPLH